MRISHETVFFEKRVNELERQLAQSSDLDGQKKQEMQNKLSKIAKNVINGAPCPSKQTMKTVHYISQKLKQGEISETRRRNAEFSITCFEIAEHLYQGKFSLAWNKISVQPASFQQKLQKCCQEMGADYNPKNKEKENKVNLIKSLLKLAYELQGKKEYPSSLLEIKKFFEVVFFLS